MRHRPSRAGLSVDRALVSLALTWGLVGLAAPGFAQDVRFEAEVNTYTLSTDDTLRLTVTLTANARVDVGEPELQASDDFVLLGLPQREERFGFGTSGYTLLRRRTFALRPVRAGDLTVPSAEISVDGTQMTTAPIAVRVTRGRMPSEEPTGPVPAPMPPSPAEAPFEGTPSFAVVCRSDANEVFVNQQLTLYVDYYATFPVDPPPGQQPPLAADFVAEDLPDPEPERVTVNGWGYERTTRCWALFPTCAGSHTLAAATEELLFRPLMTLRKFDSNVLEIKAHALPPAPSDPTFSGVVGSFTLALATDKTQLKLGQGLTVRLKADGTGNLGFIDPPKLRAPDWCKVYLSGEKRSLAPRASEGEPVLGGAVEFEYLVVPRRAGTLEIPAVRLSYFDPEEREYVTATSDSVTVVVAPGEATMQQRNGGEEASLRHIHTKTPRLIARRPLVHGPLPCAVVGACLVALLTAAGLRIRSDRRRANPRRARALGAARAARRALSKAQRAEDKDFFAVLEESVCRYLADKFSIPASGLSAEEAREQLVSRGVSENVAEDVREFVSLCHARRFAPGIGQDTSREDAMRQAEALVASLERARGNG